MHHIELFSKSIVSIYRIILKGSQVASMNDVSNYEQDLFKNYSNILLLLNRIYEMVNSKDGKNTKLLNLQIELLDIYLKSTNSILKSIEHGISDLRSKENMSFEESPDRNPARIKLDKDLFDITAHMISQIEVVVKLIPPGINQALEEQLGAFKKSVSELHDIYYAKVKTGLTTSERENYANNLFAQQPFINNRHYANNDNLTLQDILSKRLEARFEKLELPQEAMKNSAYKDLFAKFCRDYFVQDADIVYSINKGIAIYKDSFDNQGLDPLFDKIVQQFLDAHSPDLFLIASSLESKFKRYDSDISSGGSSVTATPTPPPYTPQQKLNRANSMLNYSKDDNNNSETGSKRKRRKTL